MPGKAHRVASRQAELSRKKRRAKGRPQAAESVQAAPGPATQAATTVIEPEAEARPAKPQPQPQPSQAQQAPEAPQPARRPRRRVMAEQASSSNFVGAELRRIGVIAALMLAIIVALSFVLR